MEHVNNFKTIFRGVSLSLIFIALYHFLVYTLFQVLILDLTKDLTKNATAFLYLLHLLSSHHNPRVDGKKILKRIQKKDTLDFVDVKSPKSFKRYINGEVAQLPDSLANSYANSVNSVHYFAYLPYGLNDPAVIKEYLDEVVIKDKKYHKIKVTFKQENGGDDFDDVYIYWFNTKTNKPDYLAYEFHVNDGGLRFREAFNERTVNGIRFVDYINFKPIKDDESIYGIDSMFQKGELKILSKIELKNITVNPGNYN